MDLRYTTDDTGVEARGCQGVEMSRGEGGGGGGGGGDESGTSATTLVAQRRSGGRERVNGAEGTEGFCTLRETCSRGCTVGLGGPRSRWQSYRERWM